MSEPETTVETPTDGTLSMKEVAARVGVTKQAIRNAVREKRIKPCSRPGQQPVMFTVEECERYNARHMAGREGRSAATSLEKANDAKVAIATAKAGAVSDLIEAALKHTEEAWNDSRLSYEQLRKSYLDIMAMQKDQIVILQKRVHDLEKTRDDVQQAYDTLMKSQWDQKLADAEAQKIKDQGRALIDVARTLAPAVAARFLGNEQANAGAFKGLIESMTEPQKDALMQAMSNILKPDQLTAVGILFSQWAAQESKEPAPSGGGAGS